jgi:serine/threonine protein phosphatase PrpC
MAPKPDVVCFGDLSHQDKDNDMNDVNDNDRDMHNNHDDNNVGKRVEYAISMIPCKKNEDYAYAMIQKMPGICDCAFLIFDSHSGKDAGARCVQNFLVYLDEIFWAMDENERYREDKKNAPVSEKTGFSAFLDEAIEKTTTKLDKEIKKKTTSGTTCSVCFLKFGKKHIFLKFANIGDSRTIVKGKNNEIIFQTEDHKPNSMSEQERIRIHYDSIHGSDSYARFQNLEHIMHSPSSSRATSRGGSVRGASMESLVLEDLSNRGGGANDNNNNSNNNHSGSRSSASEADDDDHSLMHNIPANVNVILGSKLAKLAADSSRVETEATTTEEGDDTTTTTKTTTTDEEKPNTNKYQVADKRISFIGQFVSDDERKINLSDIRLFSPSGASYGMSRSIGDRNSPSSMVPLPDITNLSFDYNTFAMVVLASDGVWDTRTSEQAALITGTDVQKGAKKLCMLSWDDRAFRGKAMDDISVIAISLNANTLLKHAKPTNNPDQPGCCVIS